MDKLWTAVDRTEAIKKVANDLRSCYIENKGGGKFSMRPLPLEAQTAPLFAMASEGHRWRRQARSDNGWQRLWHGALQWSARWL